MNTPEPPQLDDPWLIAVWPGMGHVSLAAGKYLVATLDVQPLALLKADQHFELDGAQVHNGVVQPITFPQNRFFAWKNPHGRDLLIFVGDKQPTLRSQEYCQRVLQVALQFGAKRVVTFASLVTELHPSQPSRVYVAATREPLLEDVHACEQEVTTLKDGEIGGLNGALLAAAGDRGVDALCILAEVPRIAVNLPYLKASQAALEVLSELAEMDLDTAELAERAAMFEKGLVDLTQHLEDLKSGAQELPKLKLELGPASSKPQTHGLDPGIVAHIESLFLSASQNRGHKAKVLELKSELDRHGVFEQYEDRFLDLFSSPPGPEAA